MSKHDGIDKMVDEATGKEYEQITIEYYQPKVIKEARGVNGPVIQYYMPLEEVHAKYGKPGEVEETDPPFTSFLNLSSDDWY